MCVSVLTALCVCVCVCSDYFECVCVCVCVLESAKLTDELLEWSSGIERSKFKSVLCRMGCRYSSVLVDGSNFSKFQGNSRVQS